MMRNPTPDESRAAIRALKLEMMRKIVASIQWLVEHPEAQTRRELATDDRGSHLMPTDPAACKWCALGRIAHDFGITPDQSDDETHNIASIYDIMQKTVMKPLGLHNWTFVSANDRYSDPESRQEELKELMWKMGTRLVNMERAA